MKLLIIVISAVFVAASAWFLMPEVSLHASGKPEAGLPSAQPSVLPAARASAKVSNAESVAAASSAKALQSPAPSKTGANAGALDSGSSAPSLSPSLSPSPSSSPSPSPSPLSDREVKDLRREYTKSQKSQVKALDHRHQTETKELEASHKARLNEWREKEMAARREYFKTHSKGAERRAYIKDYVERQQMFMNGMREEREKRRAEQQARRTSLMEQQADSRKQFETLLEKKVRPPQVLWPQPGM